MGIPYLKHAALLILGAAFLTSNAWADHECPSDRVPAPGSAVKGLTVDGVCVVNGVTVVGSTKIRNNGHLQMELSTVNGGITVEPGGELDLNATTLGAGISAGTISTVHGSITITNAFDIDIRTALVDGGILLDGSSSFPTVCGSDVAGDSSFTGMTGAIGGGPVLANPNVICPGNYFSGSVSLTNSQVVMGGNTILGDLLCTNSTVTVTSPNTVKGKNTCY